jgi:hypothetical protein
MYPPILLKRESILNSGLCSHDCISLKNKKAGGLRRR